ncbi:pyridoxal-dependent decarboxylase [Frigoribacterium sp. CFBP9039]|uniref:pyridoxal phosphate-dependent decarboxylase family protein n=1 Tax=Frigoribacterium sp. CFBP9029 TaxID=3096541 RepID=UPI002A6AED12|nr:pyridoxal-dependent decarboxylase [Frigoribacterium sp. CFBP9039]MDY0946989.1 pyridoxal-dependent decarboxylase [Frigoribacterium sp. CFBP9039]
MSDLLNASTADAYAAETTAVVDRLAHRFRTTRQPFSGESRAELQSRVDAVDLDAPGTGTADALREVDELFAANAVWFHDPAYQSHLNCPVAIPAVAAEAVLAAINPSVDTYDQSAVGTLIERRLVDWTAGRIGFDPATRDGVFTSGGTQSNLHALLLARERATATARAEARAEEARVQQQEAPGRRSAPRSPSLHDLLARMVVIATAESHFSVQKSTRLLGLGDDAVVTVPTDGAGRMRPDALDVTLDALVQAGHLPIAVVATAGTTDRGCIDPLAAIADVCDRTGVWLHVDAAYGGGLLVSPSRRRLLDGIERARSVTVDFHKTFFQPVSSSAIVVRDGRDLDPVAWHADYLNPLADPEPNQVAKSLQTTRRFDALKLWATLRALGADEVGALVDRVVDLAAEVHGVLRDDDEFDLLAETQLSTVLFRWQPSHVDDGTADRLVPLVRRVLFESGRAVVAKTVVDGRPCLKLTLLDPESRLTDVTDVLDLIRASSAALLESDDLAATASTTEGSAR